MINLPSTPLTSLPIPLSMAASSRRISLYVFNAYNEAIGQHGVIMGTKIGEKCEKCGAELEVNTVFRMPCPLWDLYGCGLSDMMPRYLCGECGKGFSSALDDAVKKFINDKKK